MKEVLVPVRRLDEAETLVGDETLDRALHAGHVSVLQTTKRRNDESTERRKNDGSRGYQRGSRRDRAPNPPPPPLPPARGAMGRASLTIRRRPPNGCSFSC